MSRAQLLALLSLAATLQMSAARAFDLPASCGRPSAATTASIPLPVLRKRLEALSESDPAAAVRLMC